MLGGLLALASTSIWTGLHGPPVHDPTAADGDWARGWSPSPQVSHAYALADKRQFSAAIEQFRTVAKGARDEETRAQAEFQIGSCLEAAGRKEAAVAQYRRLRKLYPKSYLFNRAQQRIDVCLGKRGLPPFPGAPSGKRLAVPTSGKAGGEQSPRPTGYPICGPKCLALVCKHYGIDTDPKELAHVAGITRQGTSMLGLARAAKRLGLEAKGMLLDWAALRRARKPSILWLSAGEAHFVIIEAIHADTAILVDPDLGRQEMKRPQLEMMWQGQTLVLSRKTGTAIPFPGASSGK